MQILCSPLSWLVGKSSNSGSSHSFSSLGEWEHESFSCFSLSFSHESLVDPPLLTLNEFLSPHSSLLLLNWSVSSKSERYGMKAETEFSYSPSTRTTSQSFRRLLVSSSIFWCENSWFGRVFRPQLSYKIWSLIEMSYYLWTSLSIGGWFDKISYLKGKSLFFIFPSFSWEGLQDAEVLSSPA